MRFSRSSITTTTTAVSFILFCFLLTSERWYKSSSSSSGGVIVRAQTDATVSRVHDNERRGTTSNSYWIRGLQTGDEESPSLSSLLLINGTLTVIRNLTDISLTQGRLQEESPNVLKTLISSFLEDMFDMLYPITTTTDADAGAAVAVSLVDTIFVQNRTIGLPVCDPNELQCWEILVQAQVDISRTTASGVDSTTSSSSSVTSDVEFLFAELFDRGFLQCLYDDAYAPAGTLMTGICDGDGSAAATVADMDDPDATVDGAAPDVIRMEANGDGMVTVTEVDIPSSGSDEATTAETSDVTSEGPQVRNTSRERVGRDAISDSSSSTTTTGLPVLFNNANDTEGEVTMLLNTNTSNLVFFVQRDPPAAPSSVPSSAPTTNVVVEVSDVPSVAPTNNGRTTTAPTAEEGEPWCNDDDTFDMYLDGVQGARTCPWVRENLAQAPELCTPSNDDNCLPPPYYACPRTCGRCPPGTEPS